MKFSFQLFMTFFLLFVVVKESMFIMFEYQAIILNLITCAIIFIIIFVLPTGPVKFALKYMFFSTGMTIFIELFKSHFHFSLFYNLLFCGCVSCNYLYEISIS